MKTAAVAAKEATAMASERGVKVPVMVAVPTRAAAMAALEGPQAAAE